MSIVSLRTRFLAGGAALCAAAFASIAQAQAPAAPDVTYWSAPKQMKFSWPIVPRSGYYELWFKANDGSAPVKFGELQPWIPHWTTACLALTCSTGARRAGKCAPAILPAARAAA